jgi:hypothetical protein
MEKRGNSTYISRCHCELIIEVAKGLLSVLQFHLGTLKMGVLARVKKNKVAAVIISVFDWYRTLLHSAYSLLHLKADESRTASHYPIEERKLLRKLDLAILIYGCLSCMLPLNKLNRGLRIYHSHSLLPSQYHFSLKDCLELRSQPSPNN